MSAVLPHLGAAMAVACIVLAITSQFSVNRALLICAGLASVTLCLVPIAGHVATHYVRVLTGDLSVASIVWFTIMAAGLCRIGDRKRSDAEVILSLLVVLTAVVLYPTALGLSPFDLYAEGYRPTVLGPLVFVLFALSVWFNLWLPAVMLCGSMVGYYFGWLESDNLWDYLIDPVMTIYASSLLFMERRRLSAIVSQQPELQTTDD